MKEKLIGEPDIYLRGKVRKVELETGTECWVFGLSQYIEEACRNLHKCLKDRHEKKNDLDKCFLPNSPGQGPLSKGYGPEIDVTILTMLLITRTF